MRMLLSYADKKVTKEAAGGGVDREAYRNCLCLPTHLPQLRATLPQAPTRPPSKDWFWSNSGGRRIAYRIGLPTQW